MFKPWAGLCVLGAFALVCSTSAFAEDKKTEAGATTVIGNTGNGAAAGVEGSFEYKGKEGWYDPTYYSFTGKLGAVGVTKGLPVRPIGALDYTMGYKDSRFTAVNGEATPSNLRGNIIAGRFYLRPSSDGELRFDVGLYGFHYNYDIGGDGAMRLLPVGVNYEHKLSDVVKINAALQHAFLLQMDEGNLTSNPSKPTPTTGSGYAHDFSASLGAAFKVAKNADVTLGMTVEDVKYKVLTAKDTPDQHFEMKSNTALVGKAGFVYSF